MLLAPWAIFTLIAAAAQTARNALQRHLTETLGTVGATHVRFLYGLPFGLLFFALVEAATPGPALGPTPAFFLWTLGGAVAQILATALMLKAMRERSFVVATAYIKTEPVLVALFGVVILGDHLGLYAWTAVAIATAGVLLLSWKPGTRMELRPAALGVAAAAFFGLAAVFFRGAVQTFPEAAFLQAATTTLVWSLFLQTTILTAYLLAADRPALRAILKAWRPSIVAGFLGALASQFWFLAFAVETVAKVRTLALVEVLFAGVVSGAIVRQATSPRDLAGIAMIVAGVAILLTYG